MNTGEGLQLFSEQIMCGSKEALRKYVEDDQMPIVISIPIGLLWSAARLLRSFSQKKRSSLTPIKRPKRPIVFVLNLCGAVRCPGLFQLPNSSTPANRGSSLFTDSAIKSFVF